MKQRRDLAGEQVGKRRRGALVRHMGHRNAGFEPEQFARQMGGPANAGGAEHAAAGLLSGVGNELGKVRGRNVLVHHQHIRRAGQQRQRRETAAGVIRQLATQGRGDHMGGGMWLGTTSRLGVLASSASGVKPLRVSYGSLPRKAGLITWWVAETSKVEPSGAARCTCSVPICPLAPARLSTTTGWPSACCKSLAMRRATTSVMPPGGKGTTRVMGRLGHGAASAASAGALPRHAAMAAAPSCAK